MPFAGLHQLLRPVLGWTVGCRGTPAGAAHRVRARGRASPEFFPIALAVVSTARRGAAEPPVAILIDDVQWLDPQTQEVLTFMAPPAGRHRLDRRGGADRPPGSLPGRGLAGLTFSA